MKNAGSYAGGLVYEIVKKSKRQTVCKKFYNIIKSMQRTIYMNIAVINPLFFLMIVHKNKWLPV